MTERERAVKNIQDRRREWYEKYDSKTRFDPDDITIGEVENELLRMKGLPECPMYERDYNEGWR